MQKRMRTGITFILILLMAASIGGISSLAASSGTETSSGNNETTIALADTYTDSPVTEKLPDIIDIEETLPPLDPTHSAAPSPSAPVQITEDPTPKGPASIATIEDSDVPLADAPSTGESIFLYILITILLASAAGLVWIVLREYRERLIQKKK